MDSRHQVSGDRFPSVLVLMATYNGERYLGEQIDSILKQEGVEITLQISDDCSTDGSYGLAQKYAQADSRVISYRNGSNVGVGMNFLNMLYDVDPDAYDFVAFSDQDDVWLDDKLAIACKAISSKVEMKNARSVEPFGIPFLYCSDLQNVNKDMKKPVYELRELGLKHDKRATPLLRNYYSGCTMVLNRPMVKLFQSYRLSEIFRIHDVWLALVARYCGNLIIDEDNARVLRRITGENVAGAITSGGDLANASFVHLNNEPRMQCSKTAQQLYEGFGKYMRVDDRKMVKSFASYRESLVSRLCWALRTDYCCTTFVETMYQKAKLLLGRL